MGHTDRHCPAQGVSGRLAGPRIAETASRAGIVRPSPLKPGAQGTAESTAGRVILRRAVLPSPSHVRLARRPTWLPLRRVPRGRDVKIPSVRFHGSLLAPPRGLHVTTGLLPD